MTTKIVDSVVYRHHCDCPNANQPLAEGEEKEHRFELDGVEFPWYITEEGARFTRLAKDLYSVRVEIYLVDMETKDTLTFSSTGYNGHAPVLGGVEFPWMLTSSGYTYTSSAETLPLLTLSFLVHNVDTDGDIANMDGIYNVDGELVSR